MAEFIYSKVNVLKRLQEAREEIHRHVFNDELKWNGLDAYYVTANNPADPIRILINHFPELRDRIDGTKEE